MNCGTLYGVPQFTSKKLFLPSRFGYLLPTSLWEDVFFVAKSDARVAIGAEPTPARGRGENLFCIFLSGKAAQKNALIRSPFPASGKGAGGKRSLWR